ncbi:MAG: reductive dehalogenase domain-containing protein [Candidatus Aminicenantales bacterium]
MGISLFGVAAIIEVREEFCLEKEIRDRFDRGISLGKRIIDPVIEGIKDRPTPLYFHHYRQLNFFLDRAALLLSSHIQDLGFDALPIPASQIIDWEKQKGHVSHKKIGLLAGLGWMGRNNLLVNPEFGARFRLVTVLTNMPLETDKSLETDCGKCLRCLASCPAQAIKENIKDFDHKSCYAKLSEFRRMNIVSQHICGVCVKACRGASRD